MATCGCPKSAVDANPGLYVQNMARRFYRRQAVEYLTSTSDSSTKHSVEARLTTALAATRLLWNRLHVAGQRHRQ